MKAGQENGLLACALDKGKTNAQGGCPEELACER